MSKLHNTIAVEVSPDKVWEVLGDLASCPTWVPGIVSAKVEGMNRVCTTADGHQIHEDISDYSSKDRYWSYAQLGVPLPVKNSHGKFTVKSDDRGSLIVWEAEFEVLDPEQEGEVTRMVDGFYKQTLDSLRKRVLESAQ